jgi:apolipoprotein N-acyltransferase
MRDEAEKSKRQPFSIPPRASLVVAFFLGAVTVAGYAPFYLYLLPVITVAGLCHLWHGARTPRAAATIAYAFGLGWFLFGVSWVYVSMHDFGGMPAAAAAVATLLFCAFLALFPAAVGYACGRWVAAPAARYGLLVPAAWALTEWTRGWIFTGFPWLALGYSQVPDSPLAGYAPVLGIHGVTLVTAASAGLLASWWLGVAGKSKVESRKSEGKARAKRLLGVILHPSSFILLALWAGGWGLKQVEWTQPVGAPVTVTLLQGNIPQDLKWREDRVEATLKTYSGLAWVSSSSLIILPETALPLFLDDVPKDYLSVLAEHARRNGGDILVGVPEKRPNGEYFNSVVSFGSAATQVYRKSHLVPFGEFIPLRPVLEWIVVGVFRVPLQDFARGGENQRPLEVAGQRVAVNICYEDAFGEEIIRQLPEATLLVNVSNVAWFGRSIAPSQHLQISQARALETGRYMLRATNTGVTAVIGPGGRVLVRAPEFEMATVTHAVQGYEGATPYVRMGNGAALALCALLLAVFAWMHRRTRALPSPDETR